MRRLAHLSAKWWFSCWVSAMKYLVMTGPQPGTISEPILLLRSITLLNFLTMVLDAVPTEQFSYFPGLAVDLSLVSSEVALRGPSVNDLL
jgi:hypothetical protein